MLGMYVGVGGVDEHGDGFVPRECESIDLDVSSHFGRRKSMSPSHM